MTTIQERAAEMAQQLAAEFDIQPAGVGGWLDPASPSYVAAKAFSSEVIGLTNAKGNRRTIKYMSEWPDRFGAVMDFHVFRRDGTTLQGLRSSAVQHAGLWCTPGGHTEDKPGYDLKALLGYAAGELQDETGLIYDPDELHRSIATVWQFQGDYHLERGKRFVQVVFALFPDDGKLINELKTRTNEMERLKFVDPADVLSNTVPQAFPLIQPPVLAWLMQPGGVVENHRKKQLIIDKLNDGKLLGGDEISFLAGLRA